MKGQWTAIWNHRYFWLSLAGMDLRVRYRRSVLGIGWSLLHPILMTVVFCVAFASWLGNGDWRSAAPFYLLGLSVWELVKQSALQGCQTFARNEPYIRQSPLPLVIYTLRTLLGLAIHFGIALSVAGLAALALRSGESQATLEGFLVVLPSAVLLICFCWGLVTLFSVANVFFHDTQQIAEVGFGIGFFLTPILYTRDRLTERGLEILNILNPAAVFLDLIREPILTGRVPSILAFQQAFGWTIVVVGLALAVLSRCQKRVIFHL